MLQQPYRHNGGMSCNTKHRASDLQTKIAIYLGPATRLRGSESNIFLQELAINMENYMWTPLSTAPDRHWTQAIIQNHYFHSGI